jgi:hypothetical protein
MRCLGYLVVLLVATVSTIQILLIFISTVFCVISNEQVYSAFLVFHLNAFWSDELGRLKEVSIYMHILGSLSAVF